MLIYQCAVHENVFPSYNIKVMPRGRMSISKCQKSKITCFGHNFVMHYWIFIWFCQKINIDQEVCRAL